MINPFIKIGGAEFFGNIERRQGRATTETSVARCTRTWARGCTASRTTSSMSAAGTTREGPAGRHRRTTSAVNRYQLGGGWFVTPNVLSEAEYVNQKYMDFPTTDIRNGGQFKGVMIEGVVAF